MITTRPLEEGLRSDAARIEAAARARGLSFFELVFEMVEPSAVNALCALGGFPLRYPSWRFGMEYDRLEKGRQYGLSKIYELVINNDPVHAYLVSTNSRMEQKLVMAHVCGHADFFANNAWFAPTDRHMLGRMAEHAAWVRDCMEQHGQERVERFLDSILSLDTLLDPFAPLSEHLQARARDEERGSAVERARRSLDAAMAPEDSERRTRGARPRVPSHDVLGFLGQRCELEDWQRELIRIVRAEALYFVPQRMTKIMNEGWACLWHSRLLTGGLLEASEIVDFADCHSGATATRPGQLNPYQFGLDLWRHAERRQLDLFRLRRAHHDASWVDELVDEEFASRHTLFAPAFTPEGQAQGGWKTMKDRIVRDLAWAGTPRIELVDDNHKGAGELLLRHHHDGRDLELAAAAQVLKGIAGLWQRRVHLATQEQGQPRVLSSDGSEVRVEREAAA